MNRSTEHDPKCRPTELKWLIETRNIKPIEISRCIRTASTPITVGNDGSHLGPRGHGCHEQPTSVDERIELSGVWARAKLRDFAQQTLRAATDRVTSLTNVYTCIKGISKETTLGADRRGDGVKGLPLSLELILNYSFVQWFHPVVSL